MNWEPKALSASIIVAEANNNFCGVGVTVNARVGGVRLLAKKRVLDVQETRALNYKLHEVDIYSTSWSELNNSKNFHSLFIELFSNSGPLDDGKHIGEPGKLSEVHLDLAARYVLLLMETLSSIGKLPLSDCSSVT